MERLMEAEQRAELLQHRLEEAQAEGADLQTRIDEMRGRRDGHEGEDALAEVRARYGLDPKFRHGEAFAYQDPATWTEVYPGHSPVGMAKQFHRDWSDRVWKYDGKDAGARLRDLSELQRITRLVAPIIRLRRAVPPFDAAGVTAWRELDTQLMLICEELTCPPSRRKDLHAVVTAGQEPKMPEVSAVLDKLVRKDVVAQLVGKQLEGVTEWTSGPAPPRV